MSEPLNLGAACAFVHSMNPIDWRSRAEAAEAKHARLVERLRGCNTVKIPEDCRCHYFEAYPKEQIEWAINESEVAK